MEEKERYEYYPKQNQLYDKINDELYCLGIKQDKTRLVDFLNLMDEDWWALYERNKELREEKRQLKQQLHDLPNKIMGEIRDDMSKRIIEKQIKWGDNTQIGFICNAINECLDAILKKFGGENE